MCNDLCAHCARCEARIDLSPRDRGAWHDAGHPTAHPPINGCTLKGLHACKLELTRR